ncbi:MAG: hypothetical protein QM762_09300 [Chryseolinea sp.]
MKNIYSGLLLVMALAMFSGSCKHDDDPEPTPDPTPDPKPETVLDSLYRPVDPSTAASIGFFLDEWTPKAFAIPASSDEGAISDSAPTDTINIDLNKVITKIPKYIFGNNANQWMGQIADQPALMGFLKDLNTGLMRFPGGSISDVYFWNAPVNSPPADAATTIYNNDGSAKTMAASDWWYGTRPKSENWTIALDNYYTMLAQTNNTGMISVNYGYARYGKGIDPVAAAAHLAADWVRYDKGRSKYWEIGNESAGTWEAGYKINLDDNKDGQPQIITGALYGKHFKVFADSMRKAAQQIGVSIKIGAQVIGNPQANSGLTNATWNNSMFGALGNDADFFIVHNYYAPWHQNSTAAVILKSALTETKAISTYVTSSAATNQVQMKPIAMTEWNIESEGSKQKVSAVSGIHAVLCVGEMLTNGIGQAARWDLANAWENGNDHGLFNNSAGSANASEGTWNPRAAFYYLYYMQKYLGDRLVTTSVVPANSDLVAYSSTFSSGEAATIVVNTATTNRTVVININHFRAGSKYYWYSLKPGTDNGEFSAKVIVNGANSAGTVGGPLTYSAIKPFSAAMSSQSFKVTVPARTTFYIVAEKKR